MKVLKRTIVVLMLLALAAGASGCLRVQTEIDMEMDGSGRLNYNIGLDPMLYNLLQMDEDLSLEQLAEQAEERGYSVEEYEEESFVGLDMIRDFADLVEMQEELGLLALMMTGDWEADEERMREQLTENLDFTYEEGVFRNSYSIDARLDMREDEIPEEFDEFVGDIVYEELDLGLSLNLPMAPQEHNATESSEDGRELYWQFKAGQTNEISLQGHILNLQNIIIGAVAGILLIIILIWIKTSREGGGGG